MSDFAVLAALIGFGLVSWGLIALCARLMEPVR